MKNKSLSEYSSDSQSSSGYSPLIPSGYKQTEVGVIPEDWNVQSLGNIVRIIGGGAFKSQDAMQVGVRWLKIANVGINEILWNEESFLPEQFALKFNSFLLKEGDYVLALTRPILGGVLKIAQIRHKDEPALLNQRVGKLESIDGNDLGFLYFLFQKESSVSSMQQSMAGTDPPNLSTRRVYSITCATPPTKAEQEAIAGVLSDADALIESLEQLIVKKRNLKQGAMQELFRTKSGWCMKKLEDVADVIDPHPSHRAPALVLNGIPFVGIGDLNEDGDLIGNKIRTVNPSVFDDHQNRYSLNDELIGLGRVASIGKVIKIKNIGTKYVISPTLGVIKGTKVRRDYLLYALKSRMVVDQFSRIMSGSTRSSVGMAVLRKLDISLPSEEGDQTIIAAILNDIDAEIASLETKLSKTRQLKQGMMQELLTGRIRLI